MAQASSSLTLRVGILVPNGLDGRGGIERCMNYLKEELARTAPRVSMHVFPTRPAKNPILKHPSSALGIARFAYACSGKSIDLVHINVAPGGSTARKLLCANIARRLGIPTILHLHGSGYDEFYDRAPKGAQRLIKAEFQRSTAVMVLGEHWKQFATDRLQVAPERLFVVPNGVPRQAYAGTRRRTTPTILCLGQVGLRKGTDVLLRSLALFPEKLPWRAVIAGDGAVAEYTALAQELGLGDRVHFPGWVSPSGVTQLLRDADIFVLPSRAENQPLSVIEAMASGLPVVATSIGAIPEQVEHGDNGYLVEPGNVAETSAALLELLSSPQLRCKLGANGIRTYEQRFSVRAMSQRVLAVYQFSCRPSAEAAVHA